MTAHHSFLLTAHLSMLDALDEAIERVSEEIDQRLATEHPQAWELVEYG